MKKEMLMLAVVFLLISVSHVQAANNLQDSKSFKVTVIENDVEFQWEYNNPDEYEYEHGNTVIRSDDARRKVERIFRYLQISPDARVKDMVAKLKKDGHVNLESLEIKWINSKGKLYTWVWHSKDQ